MYSKNGREESSRYCMRYGVATGIIVANYRRLEALRWHGYWHWLFVVLYVVAKSEFSSMAEERMNAIRQYRKYIQ